MNLLAPRKNPATTQEEDSDGGEGFTLHLRRMGGRGILFRNTHSSVSINNVTGTA